MGDNVVNSVGEMLRTAREARKITLDVVNQNTKISVDVLASLEQDDFDSFESDIYLKGFLKTYANYLHIDVHEVLRALDRQRGKYVTGTGTMWDIEESVKEEIVKAPKIFRRVIVPLLLALIVILLFLLIKERRDEDSSLTPRGTQGYLQSENRCDIA
jgi:cytoskeletal protein RodZ